MERKQFAASDLTVFKHPAGEDHLVLGSFVRLNSGGPPGVVEALHADGRADIVWIGGGARSKIPTICVRAIHDSCGFVTASPERS